MTAGLRVSEFSRSRELHDFFCVLFGEVCLLSKERSKMWSRIDVKTRPIHLTWQTLELKEGDTRNCGFWISS